MRLFGRIVPALLTVLAATAAFGQADEFVKGEVLVKFKGVGSVNTLSAGQANSAIGASNKRVINQISVHNVKLPSGMDVMDAVAYYRSLTTVQYAEPNFKGKYYYTPNDPMLNQQYGVNITKCKEAWNLTKGKATVVIAVIDSGFDLTHEDMQGKFVPGWDFAENDNDPTFDSVDHGVHCAGIAGAATDNGKGVAASSFNCKVMPLKLGDVPETALHAQALIYAADHGAKVASMSYGNGDSQTSLNAVNYAWNKGMVLLAAAGNDGTTNKGYPAAYDKVIAVGATNSSDLRTNFSTHGADWVDVGAPGAAILSTIPGGYAAWDGTSMACPMAASIVGLLWSISAPGTTNTQIRNALESSTDPIGNGGFKFGRVNALKACQKLDTSSATISPATGVSVWEGTDATGTVVDVTATDGNAFRVNSTPTSLGHIAGASVDITFNGPSSGLQEAFVLVEANSSVTGTTGQLFLWNYSSNKFVLIKAIALRPSGVKRERVTLPLNLSNYVSGGQMKLGVRALGPKRAPRTWPKGTFEFSLGFVQVGTRELPAE